VITRRHETAFAICSGVRPCSDGYINLLGNGPRLPAVLRMIGREDLVSHPEVAGPEECISPELVEEIETSYLGWTVSHTMREALAIAQQHRILGGTVHTIADVLADPTFRDRGAWETIAHPVAGTLEYPSRPFILSDSPRPAATRAPLLGEHTEQVLCGELGYSGEDYVRLLGVGAVAGHSAGNTENREKAKDTEGARV
jgi:crotonobetainyl-CoA:carnitine CoA-transferase CaiB-like acyl-CoA transferase